MEFVIAIVGVALAVWMIVGARGRHRDDSTEDPAGSDRTGGNTEPPR